MSTTHVTTAEELWRLPDEGNRHELVRGELRTAPYSGCEHGFVVVRVASPLHSFAKAHGPGIVLGAGAGFQIAKSPDTVRAPDVAFVRRDRIPQGGIPKAFWPIAPDLAVEVVSPGDTVEEVDEKVADWLDAGTEVVWVVRPKSRTVTIYRKPNVVQILTAGEEIDGGELLPGFRCRVSELFTYGLE